MIPQRLFLALNIYCLHTYKCSLYFPNKQKQASKNILFIFLQLYLNALTCRTDVLFKNIFKDIFRQLLNCKILSQNILNNPYICDNRHMSDCSLCIISQSGAKSRLFQNLVKMSDTSVPTCPILFSYCLVNLVIMICNQIKLILH